MRVGLEMDADFQQRMRAALASLEPAEVQRASARAVSKNLTKLTRTLRSGGDFQSRTGRLAAGIKKVGLRDIAGRRGRKNPKLVRLVGEIRISAVNPRGTGGRAFDYGGVVAARTKFIEKGVRRWLPSLASSFPGNFGVEVDRIIVQRSRRSRRRGSTLPAQRIPLFRQ